MLNFPEWKCVDIYIFLARSARFEVFSHSCEAYHLLLKWGG